MGAGHDHGTSTASASALTKALILTFAFLIAEIIGGLLSGSLALLSDAAHMMTDTAGLAIALAGVKIGARAPDARRTFGYKRFEILAASVNAVLLFIAAGYILYEGYRRLIAPPDVQSIPMFAIACAGLVVNLIAMRLLSEGHQHSLNVKGAYLEVYSDMLGSLGVIAAAIVIYFTGWNWVDALTAIGIGLWVLPRSYALLKETTNILLEGVPDGIDVAAVEAALKAVPGVKAVHDLHIWAITSGAPSLSAHVLLSEGAIPDNTRQAAARMLQSEFQITHTTLQTELQDCAGGCERGALSLGPGHGHEHENHGHEHHGHRHHDHEHSHGHDHSSTHSDVPAQS